MKKIYLIFISFMFLLSCMTKVDLEQKGRINLLVQWPNTNSVITSESSSISRAIKEGTTSITVKIHPKGNPSGFQEKIITNTGANKYSVNFDNLTEGMWHILITAKDNTGNILTEYEDFVEVNSSKDSTVKTDFSGLSNLFIYEDLIYNSYVRDGTTGIISTSLAINFKGFNDKTINELLFQSPLLNSNIKFLWSTYSDFSIITGEYSYPVSYATMAMVNVGIIDSIYVLNSNTKYYWKAIATIEYNGSSYTKESPVYSFTTGTHIP